MPTHVPELLSRNATYAAERHVHRSAAPAMNTLVVSCLDARTAPESFLGLHDGEALVMRNLGGRVTDAVCEQVGILAGLVRVAMSPDAQFEIVLVHHTECGLQRLAVPAAGQKVAAISGVSPEAIAHIAIHDHEATLAEDLERLNASPLVPAGLAVTGLRYDAATGALDQVLSAVTQ